MTASGMIAVLGPNEDRLRTYRLRQPSSLMSDGDSSDGGSSSLDEPPPSHRRADMPMLAGSLEAFAMRQRLMRMEGRGPPASIQLSMTTARTPATTAAAAAAAKPLVTPGSSTAAAPPAAAPASSAAEGGRQQGQTTGGGESPSPNKQQVQVQQQGAGAGPGGQLHRLNIFVLVRILFHYLEKVDSKLLLQAKQVLKECDKRKKAGEPEYQNLADVIPPRIKACVGEHHWSKALAIQRQFLKSKQKQCTRGQQTPPAAAPAPAPLTPTERLVAQHRAQQQQRSAIVARKFAQAGVLATNVAGVPLAAVPAAHRGASLHRHVHRRPSRRRGEDEEVTTATDDDESDDDDEGDRDESDDDDDDEETQPSHKHRRQGAAGADASVSSGEKRSSISDEGDGGSSSSLGEKRAATGAAQSRPAANETFAAGFSAAYGGRHKRVLSAPHPMLLGGGGILRRDSSCSSGRQDSFMEDSRPGGGIPGAGSQDSHDSQQGTGTGTTPVAAAGAAIPRHPSDQALRRGVGAGQARGAASNIYSGQEQQAAPQRRRRDDSRMAMPIHPVHAQQSPPLPQASSSTNHPNPFGLRPAVGLGSSGESLAANFAAAQAAAAAHVSPSAAANHFSLTGNAKPFSPSGYSLFNHHRAGAAAGTGPAVISGGNTPPPLPPSPSPDSDAAGVAALPLFHRSSSGGAALRAGGGGMMMGPGPPPNGVAAGSMNARSRGADYDSLACSDDDSSDEEECAVVDVEEDEIDDGTMLRHVSRVPS